MKEDNLLDQIKEELFGTKEDGQATDDGFLIKLRYGEYDDKQYERIYSLFSKFNEKLVEKDEEAANTICYYTEFISKLLLFLNNTKNTKLSETSADLVGMWGRI